MPLLTLATLGRFETIDQVMLGAYLAAMVAMGVYFARREKSTDDYFRGGRRVPWWAAGMSIFGTALSSITYVSVPGNAFSYDWSMMIAQVSPLLLVPVVAAVYIPFYRKLDVTTPYEYLQKRFNTPVRLLASAQWVLFQFVRMSIIIYLPSLALSTMTGIDITLCILLMGLVTTIYTMLGGIEAAVWTDVVQVVVLMGGAVVCALFAIARVDGGFGAILAQGAEAGKFHTFDWSWDCTRAAVWVLAVGAAVSNFAVYSTDQALVQRYIITPDTRAARRALWTSALGGVPSAFLFFFLGTAMWVFYRQNPALLPAETGGDIARMKGDSALPLFMVQQLPPGASGLVIAGIFAAAMSTICSGVNSIATAVTTDFVRRFRPAVGERSLLKLARVLSLAIGAIATTVAVVLARANITSQYRFFMSVLGLFTGGLAGLFVLGIFTRRATAAGALAGALASAGVVLLVSLRPKWVPVHDMLYGVVTLSVCVIVGYLASLVLPGRARPLANLTVFTSDRRTDRPPAAESPAPPAAAGAPVGSSRGSGA